MVEFWFTKYLALKMSLCGFASQRSRTSFWNNYQFIILKCTQSQYINHTDLPQDVFSIMFKESVEQIPGPHKAVGGCASRVIYCLLFTTSE